MARRLKPRKGGGDASERGGDLGRIRIPTEATDQHQGKPVGVDRVTFPCNG
jgi:hypothetical protein